MTAAATRLDKSLGGVSGLLGWRFNFSVLSFLF